MQNLTTTLSNEELLNAGRVMERQGYSDFESFVKDAVLEKAAETLAKEEK